MVVAGIEHLTSAVKAGPARRRSALRAICTRRFGTSVLIRGGGQLRGTCAQQQYRKTQGGNFCCLVHGLFMACSGFSDCFLK
jgi:hypothetical protein